MHRQSSSPKVRTQGGKGQDRVQKGPARRRNHRSQGRQDHAGRSASWTMALRRASRETGEKACC